MASEPAAASELELGHVLFMDIVGYSKLMVDEQSELAHQLNRIVRDTGQVRSAEAKGKLIRLPTGDGMALVFFTSPEAPMQCALEISRALKENPAIKLRMGLHSGPVNPVFDVNERENVAGIGINIAQRVMDCGDAGHILLSKRVAEDLSQYARWRDHLYDLGQVEVKHGVKLDIVNFYSDEVGNAELPGKFKQSAQASRLAARRKHKKMLAGTVVLGAILSGAGFWVFSHWSSLRIAYLPASDKSIAVLPFENLSDEKENAYFADGVQDEILTDLAKIADLRVISRTSVMPYKAGSPRNLREIAQQLGVAHILEGSVQRAAGKVRVNAQLIDARSDKHLWGQTYDRALADVFTIETEVAQAIAKELQAKLSPAEKVSIEDKPTTDIVAYDLYVRAISLFPKAASKESREKEKDLLQAVDLLNQAVARDPGFLLAYCRLAEAHDQLYFQSIDHTPNRLALAKEAIDSAFRLKPDSGEAHLALAGHLYWGYFDYDRARDELAVALRTLPNNARLFLWSGFIDRRQNRWRDAVRNHERALELDPRNIMNVAQAAMTYSLLRDYDKAGATADRLLALEPNNILYRLYRAEIEVGERADLRPVQGVLGKNFTDDPALLKTNASECFLFALYGRNAVAADKALAAVTDNTFGIKAPVEWSRAYAKGLVARMKGDEDGARAAFNAARTEQKKVVRTQPDDTSESGALCSLGLIDAALGRKQEALSEGRGAVELLPVTKNAMDGPGILYFYAAICAQVGESDLAIEQLKTLAQIPAGADYGALRLDPFWDPLRGDPRFEKIVSSLAPKEN